jgi:hypothetical protein
VDLPQQLRQLGDVGGDAPGFVAGEELGRCAPARLILEVDVGERLPLWSRKLAAAGGRRSPRRTRAAGIGAAYSFLLLS